MILILNWKNSITFITGNDELSINLKGVFTLTGTISYHNHMVDPNSASENAKSMTYRADPKQVQMWKVADPK